MKIQLPNKPTKKVLVIWPEEEYVMLIHTKIPKRWAYLVEIFSYLKKNTEYEFTIMDCMDPRFSNGEVLTEVASGKYSCVILMSRFETPGSIIKLSKWIKQINPLIKILVYGDLSALVPNFFKREASLDAILMCGDWEMGIADYLDFLNKKIPLEKVRGVEIYQDHKWIKFNRGTYLPNNSWTLPDLDSNLFSRDLYLSLAKQEVTMSISRGCPFNCKFCTAVSTFGIADRRKNIDEIIEYISKNKTKVKSFKLFSPTFTFDTKWVKEFCQRLIQTNNIVKWCATTRPDMVDDEEMVSLMSKSGCYKIAMGIETMDGKSNEALKKFNENYPKKVQLSLGLFKKYHIEVKALMMLGISGQTATNIEHTYSLLEKYKASIRAAAYSPRERLRELDITDKVTLEEIVKLDKMTFYDNNINGVNYTQFLNLIYNVDDYEKILSND